VPEVKICTRQISFRCEDEIYRVLIPKALGPLTKNKSLNIINIPYSHVKKPKP
jgi:hypothetical protein